MKTMPRLILTALFTLTACTSTSSQSGECVANNEILEKLEAVIPYAEHSLSFYTSEEGSSLTLWVLDPTLNAHDFEGFRDSLPTALLQVTGVIHQFYVTDECVKTLFEFIYVIIVDPEYVGWFSGTLPMENIPDSAKLTEEELVNLTTSFDVDYNLREPIEFFLPPPETACTWSETHEKILRHFPAANANVDFFYVFDALGSAVWAQFTVPKQDDTVSYVLSLLAQIIDELDCLYPPPDKIITIVTDKMGEVLVVGTLPGAPPSSDAAINGFDISDYSFQIVSTPEASD
jgi:hypothetical protein